MISAQDVKRLREVTGVGMMDCKGALTEANGDFEAAIDLLRKKGQKVAAKRAEREAKEGVIATGVSSDGLAGVIVEVNCETDFVARNSDFVAFSEQVVDLLLEKRPADLKSLLSAGLEGGRSVQDAVTDMTGKIGEKIDIRRFNILESKNGNVVAYVHPGAKLGVIVEIAGSANLDQIGRDVAMHVAAMSPVATSRSEVPKDLIDKELDIAREIARTEGKPEQIIEKIAQGKLDRYYKDNVLLEQPFVKESSVTVSEMLAEAGASVKRFARFALGAE